MYTLLIIVPEGFHDFIYDEIQKDVRSLNSNKSEVVIDFSNNTPGQIQIHLSSVTKDPMLLPLIGWMESFYKAKLIWTNREEVTIND